MTRPLTSDIGLFYLLAEAAILQGIPSAWGPWWGWLWSWMFRYLPDSAWAAANWADIAEQLSKIVELQEWSQQKVVSDQNDHPVSWRRTESRRKHWRGANGLTFPQQDSEARTGQEDRKVGAQKTVFAPEYHKKTFENQVKKSILQS